MKIANKEFQVLSEAEGLRISAMYLSKFPVTGTILATTNSFETIAFHIATDNAVIWGTPRTKLIIKIDEIVEFLD